MTKEIEEKVTGIYVHQLFFAEDSKYHIIRIELLTQIADFYPGDVLTITGNFNELTLNKTYEFHGEMIEHATYGHQFKAMMAMEVMPRERENIIHYLKSLKLKGIGERTIASLYDELGSNMLEIILNEDSQQLATLEINRWNSEKAQVLKEALLAQEQTQSYYYELITLGFSSHIIPQLFEHFGNSLQECIKENCYQILEIFDGITLKTLDEIVEAAFPEQLSKRLKYATIYYIKNICYQTGSTFVTKDELSKAIQADRLADSIEAMDLAIETLINEKKIYINQAGYALDYFYNTEKNIALKVNDLQSERGKYADYGEYINKYITLCEENFGIIYDNQQTSAIEQAFLQQLFLITGGPGTGKTTIIRAIIEIFRLLQKSEKIADAIIEQKIALLAPTGRAAQRLQDATGLSARTIHSFLGWDLHTNTYRNNEQNPISNITFVIVDEASMIDIWLFSAMLKALPNLQYLIIVGDADQLPSVSNGQAFLDLLSVEQVSHIALTKIFRQKENSTIIDVANQINLGKASDIYFNQSSDYSFIALTPNNLLIALEKICLNALKNGYELTEIQVLAPLYKGQVGIDLINKHLQKVFNPDTYEDYEHYHVANNVVFLPNDKVIQLKNMPDFDVYNGDIGQIVSIETGEKNTVDVCIDFNGTFVIYNREEMQQIKHGYCISIHKAQGSEFPVVIMPVFFQYGIMLYRQLLYTGASRAKKALVLLGVEQALLNGIQNDRKNLRQTMLTNFLSDETVAKFPDNLKEALSQGRIGEELSGITPWDFLERRV